MKTLTLNRARPGLQPISRPRPAMGRVMNYLTPSTETAIPAADDRLICDDVEMLLDMMVGIQRDPEAVA